MEEEIIARIKQILDQPEENRQRGETRWVGDQITDMKYFCKLVKDKEQRNEFARYVARYVKYQFIAQGEELFRMGMKNNLCVIILGAPGGEFYLIMKGKVDVFIPKSYEQLEHDLKDVSKKDVFNKYDEFVKETFRSRGENFPKWFIPDEEETDARKLYKARSTTIDSSIQKRTRDEFTDLIKNEKLIQSMRKYILLEKNGIWNGDPQLDFSPEEKLLFLNHTKIAPYFLNQIATFRRINQLNSGDYLGEIALIFNSTRTASIIAAKDTYLLWLTEKDYKEIFQSEVENVREKVDFISHIFSNTEKPQVSKFCYLLEEQQMYNNEVLFKEGDKADHIYIVRHGEIQLTTVIKQEHQSRENSTIKKQPFYRRKLIIQTLKMGSFFGEDEFLSKTTRKYTAISSVSGTLIYKINRNVKVFHDIIEKYFTFIADYLKKNHRQKSKKLRESMIKQAEIRLGDFKQIDGMLGKMNEEKKEKYDRVYTRPTLTEDKKVELRVSVKKIKNESLLSIPSSEILTERSNRSPSKPRSPEKIERLSIATKGSERYSLSKLDKKNSIMSLSQLNIKRYGSEVYSSQGNRDMLSPELRNMSPKRSISPDKSLSPDKRSISPDKSASGLKFSPPATLQRLASSVPDVDNTLQKRLSQPSMPSLPGTSAALHRSDTKINRSNTIFNSRYTLIDRFELDELQKEKDYKDKEQSKKQFMHIMKRVFKDNKPKELVPITQPEIVQTIIETPINHQATQAYMPYLTTYSTEVPSTRDSDSRFTNLHLENNFAKDFAKYKTLLSFRPLNGSERLYYQQRVRASNNAANTSAASQRPSMPFSKHKKNKSSRTMLLDDTSINKTIRTGTVGSPRSPSSIMDFNRTIQVTEPGPVPGTGNSIINNPHSFNANQNFNLNHNNKTMYSGFRGKKYN